MIMIIILFTCVQTLAGKRPIKLRVSTCKKTETTKHKRNTKHGTLCSSVGGRSVAVIIIIRMYAQIVRRIT
jgi:hypothetical protein